MSHPIVDGVLLMKNIYFNQPFLLIRDEEWIVSKTTGPFKNVQWFQQRSERAKKP